MTAVPATGSTEYHILRARRGQRNARLSSAGVAALGPTNARTTPRKARPVSNYIQIGQVYTACNPRDIGIDGQRRRIRVVEILQPFRVAVETIDAKGYGTRRRQMYTDHLHASPLTKRGVARTRGYVLETGAAR